MPTVIAVVGGKKSGKTTAIEILTKELTNKGYNVATVKHIPEPNFTIDSEGKDTWKYAQAGAKVVVAVSAREIATIEKTDSATPSLEAVLRKCSRSDLVFLEGFRDLVAKKNDIYKIVVVRSFQEVAESLQTFNPILAFTGPYRPVSGEKQILYVDIRKDSEKLTDLIEKIVVKKTAR